MSQTRILFQYFFCFFATIGFAHAYACEQMEQKKLSAEKQKEVDVMLYQAVHYGNGVAAQYAIDCGANMEACMSSRFHPPRPGIDYDDRSYLTMLAHGAREGHSGVIQVLLKNKANVHGHPKFPPIILATLKIDVLQLLLDHKAAVNSKDWLDRTPLYMAVRFNKEALPLLFSYRAPIDAKSYQSLVNDKKEPKTHFIRGLLDAERIRRFKEDSAKKDLLLAQFMVNDEDEALPIEVYRLIVDYALEEPEFILEKEVGRPGLAAPAPVVTEEVEHETTPKIFADFSDEKKNNK